MSKGNNPVKVLKTALKRINKGWAKSSWATKGEDGGMKVCIEGAIYGYCSLSDMKARGEEPTEAQVIAIRTVKEVIAERHPERANRYKNAEADIPFFNDGSETGLDEVQEVIKLAMIRLETGGDEVDEEEVEDLLDFLAKK